MFKNFWYAIEFAKDVSTTPKKTTCLGQELAVFRTESGQPVVLNDLCVHRGASLSAGQVKGDCVVCPYHGWEYASDGKCTKIPYKPKANIPKKARTDSYPVEERYGFVWVFLGDLPQEERPPIPTWPEFDDRRFRAITGEFHWSANYERVVENSVDIAHGPFVHAGMFGDPNRPEIPEHDVDVSEWAATATVELDPVLPSAIWGLLNRRKERLQIPTTVSFFMPNLAHLRLQLPVGELVVYDTNIPVDETTTVTKWVALRTFFTRAWADKLVHRYVIKVFEQDQRVVERIRPELIPFELASELHVKVDAVSLAYRRMRDRAFRSGWGVESHRIETPTRVATVIPSPARREVPELARAWVLKETPVTVRSG